MQSDHRSLMVVGGTAGCEPLQLLHLATMHYAAPTRQHVQLYKLCSHLSKSSPPTHIMLTSRGHSTPLKQQ